MSIKKLAAAMLALALLASAAALAFEGTGYPAWDGASAPESSLVAAFGGENLALAFDPSLDYSGVANGLVTACFFAYDENETHYLELYLCLPQDVLAGDAITQSDACDCSVSLYETSISGESVYFAGTAFGGDPAVGSFELRIEEREASAATLHLSGSLTAQLIGFEQDQPTQSTLDITAARFDFTLPLTSAAAQVTPEPAPGTTPAPTFPALPEATFPALPENPFAGLPEESDPAGVPNLGGAPAFTLPPDYAVI